MANLLQVETITGTKLSKLGDGLKPETRVKLLKQAMAAWRSVIREEWTREAWNSPSGGFRPWKKTAAFGDFPAPAKTLLRSGKLLAAYLGAGAGSFERLTAEGIEFGVLGSVIPYAAVHRGGGTKVLLADAGRPFVITVTSRQRAFLHFHGVHLKAGTKFIKIPRRPHATANPEVRTRISAIFAAGLVGRAVPERLTA